MMLNKLEIIGKLNIYFFIRPFLYCFNNFRKSLIDLHEISIPFQ